MKLFKLRTVWLPTWQGWTVFFMILIVFLVVFFINAHRFLAVTSRVPDADILVVEDWMADVFLQATAVEFKKGNYRLLLISGLREYDSHNDVIQNVRKSSKVNRLISLGVPKDQIMECFTPVTEDHRSAAMAGAVRDALRQHNIKAKGVNVLAPATHARKTWLVYRRALASGAAVGIVAIAPGIYDPDRWWQNSQSAKWVLTNYAGLFYEWITGL